MSGIFTIPIGGLKEGQHYFEYKINKAFFEQFEESEISEGDLTACVEEDDTDPRWNELKKLMNTN